jgi:hypothetical protein
LKKKKEIINPIDKDNITEKPGTLTYGHHRGSFPVIPTKQGAIKSKAISAMEYQTEMQLDQIKQQMSLLAQQANTIKDRVEISEMIYHAEIRFEPIISHIYHLYKDDDEKFYLMMIASNEWGRKGSPLNFISTVKLLSDHTWEVIK